MADTLSRRTFITASLSLTGWVPGAAAASARTYCGLPMGIQSYSLRAFDFDGVVERVRRLGLHHMELAVAHLPPESGAQELKARVAKLRAAKITPTGFGVVHFGKDHEANRKLFVFARTCGIRSLSADPEKNHETFDSLEKLVTEFGVNVAIHNHGPGSGYVKPEDVLAWTSGRPRGIGACADLGHYIRAGVDPMDALAKLADRLHGIHLKDCKTTGKDAVGCVLGEGVLKVKPVMQALARMRFRGALSLEYEDNMRDPVPDIERCLTALAVECRALKPT